MTHDDEIEKLDRVLSPLLAPLWKVACRELRAAQLPEDGARDVSSRTLEIVTRKVRDGVLTVGAVRNWMAYLSTIVRGVVRDELHLAQSHSRAFPAGVLHPATEKEPWEQLDGDTKLPVVRLLPELWRSLLILHFEDDLSVNQAAAELGLTRTQAWKMIHDLRRKVQVIRRGGALRGRHRDAFAEFAQGVLKLQAERSEHA